MFLINKNKGFDMRKWQILFCSIFFLFLAYLGCFVDCGKVNSLIENRSLTKWSEVQENGREVFERYISDRIPFRDNFLIFYFSLNLKLDKLNQQNLEGKDGWMFQVKINLSHNLPALDSFQNKDLLSQSQLDTMVANVQKIKKYCDENNIKFYLIFPPDKSRIYSKFMPSYILRKEAPSFVKRFISYLPKNISVIPIESELIEFAQISEDLLYYKEDAHWSEDGAFFAYHQLMKAIQKDFPAVQVLTKDDFVIEKNKVYDLYNARNKPVFFYGNQYMPKYGKEITLYNHYTYKRQNDVTVVWKKNFNNSTNKTGNPLSVYIVGDSFACYLHPFFSATFQRVRGYRFNMPEGKKWGILFNDRKREFAIEKPDILIFSISELKLKDLLQVD